MTPKEWFALFGFYAAYLFFGASVFYHNEHALETVRRRDELTERIEINELLTKHLASHDLELQNELLVRLSGYCDKKVTNYTLDEYEDPFVWNFYHSFYFAFIVCSTIGYGNISPNNTFGRIFMIFYALIGLPVNGFFFAYIGELYGKTYIRLYQRYKAYKLSNNSHYVPRKVNFIGQIVLYLIPGIVIFIFIPACIFCYFEKWPYDVGVYYSFVTLTTIGFGDYTSTFEASQEHEFGTAFVFYQVFVILWFFTGVGYVFMILGFIAKGLAHKKVQRLEKLLAMNVKETQQRVWNGVTKDISYLRKILNEVYMLKFKPVYHEPADRYASTHLSRSDSCPELSMYREPEDDFIAIARKRAYSMNMVAGDLLEATKPAVSLPSLCRRLSDSDLSRINREKTFGVQALIQPAELLARVVTALGNITTIEEDTQSILEQASLTQGINCFSDSQILASERTWSGWSVMGSDKSNLTPPPMGRPRASSDIGLPPHHSPANPNDWTWSGGDNLQIKEMLKDRQKAMKSRNALLRAAISNSKQFGSNLSINNPPTQTELQPAVATVNKSLLQRLNPFRKRSASSDINRNSIYDVEAPRPVEAYLAKTANGRASMFNLSQNQYLSATSAGRGSVLSLPPTDEHVLETTTIGDLIRALEIMHMHATKPHLLDDGPKRKVGTATAPTVSPLTSLFTNPHSLDAGSRRGSIRRPLGPSLSNPLGPPSLSNSLHSSPLGHSPSSLRSGNPPPYSAAATTYVASPKPLRRRFSVRPSNLAYPPGQCPRSGSVSLDTPLTSSSTSLHIPTTTLQRRLSTRPSPLASMNQNLLTVPSTVGSVGPGSALNPSKPKPWRPALFRSDSDQTSVPSALQRATASSNVAAAGARCRHSSLCQLEEPKRSDFS